MYRHGNTANFTISCGFHIDLMLGISWGIATLTSSAFRDGQRAVAINGEEY